MKKTGSLATIVLLVCAVLPFVLTGDDAGSGGARDAQPVDGDEGAGRQGAAAFKSANWSRDAVSKPARDTEPYSALDELDREEQAERAAALADRRRKAAGRLEGVEIIAPMPPKEGK